MLELEQKSECCTKNDVWQTEKPFGHFIILDLADFQLVTVSALQVNNYKYPSSGRCCCFRGEEICRDFGGASHEKTAHESPFQAHGVEGHKAKAPTKVLEIGGLKDFTSRENQNMGKVRHLKGEKNPIFQDLRWRKFQWPRQGGHFFGSPKKTVSFWVDGVGRCPWSAALLIRVDMSPWTCPASEVPRLWKYRNP